MFSNNIFSDKVFSEINPFHFLGGSAFGPMNCTLIVVVERNGCADWEGKITEEKFELKNKLGSFIDGVNFSLTAALCSFFMSETSPCNGCTRM